MFTIYISKYISGMNIFVAFFVLLLLLSESTPKAAENIPLIGKICLVYAYTRGYHRGEVYIFHT